MPRRRPARPMCAVDRTDFAANMRTGRTECWGAVSKDGIWHFVREDDTRTDWLLYHWPSVQDESYTMPVDQFGTLNAAREAVARGWLDKILPERKAEWAGHMARIAAICQRADYDQAGKCRICRQTAATHNPAPGGAR